MSAERMGDEHLLSLQLKQPSDLTVWEIARIIDETLRARHSELELRASEARLVEALRSTLMIADERISSNDPDWWAQVDVAQAALKGAGKP